MRSFIGSALLALLTTPALADNKPLTVRGETIEIEGRAPVAVPPQPKKNYHAIAPSYSDYAIEHDVWTKAWVLLDIDEHGNVARMKMIKHPGADLEIYAVDFAFNMHFTPATDASGHAMRMLYFTSIEWPSYWWMVSKTGLAVAVPAGAEHVPCRGQGPVNIGSVQYHGYRDCSEPDLSKAVSEPWIVHSH